MRDIKVLVVNIYTITEHQPVYLKKKERYEDKRRVQTEKQTMVFP